MSTLLERDVQWLTEIGKLGKAIANDVGGSQAIQAAVVQSVMMIMASEAVARRSTYQFDQIGQQQGPNPAPPTPSI